MDASLKELMSLVREVNPESRKKGTYFDFAIGKPYDQKTELLELILVFSKKFSRSSNKLTRNELNTNSVLFFNSFTSSWTWNIP